MRGRSLRRLYSRANTRTLVLAQVHFCSHTCVVTVVQRHLLQTGGDPYSTDSVEATA
jgi:hypothetical protein